jgi:hypothetical protein
VKHPAPRKRQGPVWRVGRLLRSLGLLLGAGGIVVVGMQAIWWFQDGFWTTETPLNLWLSLGNAYSIRAASGADRIALQLLDLPLGPILLALALALLMAARSFDR